MTQRPTELDLEESYEQIHKILIIISLKHVQKLEKICSVLGT